MRCTDPRTVSFQADGKTLAWSQKKRSKEFAPFQLPCGQCIQCRLHYASEWATRCVHETKVLPNPSSFITLTYSDENLRSNKLQYVDFQLFAKRLRKRIFSDFLKSYGKNNWMLLGKDEKKLVSKQFEIGYFVTGEYGDKKKRPHWHAIIFNWRPDDAKPKYKNSRGDQVWESETLSKLWSHGTADFGSVTRESAGYVARYSAKKLGHSKEFNGEYPPISKKSCKQAIGRSWLEKYFWTDCFLHGHIRTIDGTKIPIPRYYEKWLKTNKPDLWLRYVTAVKPAIIESASKRTKEQHDAWLAEKDSLPWNAPTPITQKQMRKIIDDQKFDQLQKQRKL